MLNALLIALGGVFGEPLLTLLVILILMLTLVLGGEKE